MTELRFELPNFVRLSEAQIALINGFDHSANIDFFNYPGINSTLEEIKEAESIFGRNFFDLGDFRMPGSITGATVSSRPIAKFDEEISTWHFEGMRGINTHFGVASSIYPTEFAECDMVIDSKTCANFMNNSTEFEEIQWLPKDFQENDNVFDDYFLLFSSELDRVFGHNWLIDASECTNSRIRSLLRVSNLSIVQALPGSFAFGNIEKILHRMPSSPTASKRNLFRAFSINAN